MLLDNLVNEAITNSVEEGGQPESLAAKIIAWVATIASGNESRDDADSAYRRVRLLYEDTELLENVEEK